jgi:inosine/xanthosine triphosphatase
MTKCYLGSLNKVKLAAVKEVLQDFEVIGMDVDSKVGAQPLSDAQTILGAKNRALMLPEDGLRIGLEAGVQFHDDVLFLVNWGVLIDQERHFYYAGGTRIPLPDFVRVKLIDEGQELAAVMEDYLQVNDVRSKEGAIGYFTNSLVKRKDIFVHIVKLLYGQYLRREENR